MVRLAVASLVILALLAGGRGRADAAPGAAGLASWYGAWHEGRLMANGCPFHAHALSAASLTLPIGSWVRVHNRRNHRTVIVPILDRGPYIKGRIIDLSRAAAEQLDTIAAGVVMVDIEPLDIAPQHGCLPARTPMHDVAHPSIGQLDIERWWTEPGA